MICEILISDMIKANIFLFLVLQTFSKIFRAGGGKKKKLSIFSTSSFLNESNLGELFQGLLVRFFGAIM